MTLLLALLIGILAGLRSMTAPAVTAWAARLGWLRLTRPLSYIGSLPAVVILTLFAVGEYVVDKLPGTPARTSPPGLIARIVTGGLSGACVASSGGAGALTGALLGAVGGVIGCFGGFQARTKIVKALGVRDIYVALVEDLVAVTGCLLILSRV